MIRWKLAGRASTFRIARMFLARFLFLSPKVVRRLSWSSGLADCAGHGITPADNSTPKWAIFLGELAAEALK
jgi:hypothetical protein